MLKIQDEKGSQNREWSRPSANITSEGHDIRPILVFILIISLINLFFGFQLLAATGINGRVSLMGDSTHLEFDGVKQWEYNLKVIDANTVEIEVPELSTKFRGDLTEWSSEHINQVEIQTGLADGRNKLRFKTKGKQIQSFDYLTDDPARLIVDFFKDTEAKGAAAPLANKGPNALAPKSATEQPTAGEYKTLAKVEKKKEEGENTLSEEEAAKYKKTAPSREPASELDAESPMKTSEKIVSEPADKYDPVKIGLFDAGDPDYKRFQVRDYEISEEAIIASRENIYIRFPMLKVPVSRLEDLLKDKPEYVITPKEDAENKEAQFLVVLHGKQRYASFLKVATYFLEKYPQTEYREIVEYMLADTYFALYQRDQQKNDLAKATNLYEKLVYKYPNSPLRTRTRKLLNYIALEQGKGLEIVQQFQKYIGENPDPEEIDQSKMALAEGHLILKQNDAAMAIYDDIEKTAKTEVKKVEANFRKGDAELERRDYAAAVQNYLASEKKYPAFVKVFPNLSYNLAESYFWLGEYKKSIDRYREYLSNFPKHEYNSYALTRVGELLEIMGADPSRVLGAFMESTFRFQDSPGAKVARVRTLSRRMKGMKEKELEKAKDELLQIAKDSKLPRMEEFVTLMISDGYYRRGEYTKSLNYIVSYYQKNPMNTSLQLFKKRIVGNISNLIHQDLDKDDFLASLEVYNKYKTTWLRNVDRIDIPFFVGQSFEKAGVYGESEKVYSEVEARLEKIKGTREWLERKVHEHLPSLERIHLRQASIALNQREYSKAYDHLKAIKEVSNLTEPEKVERVQLGSRIYEERGQPKEALDYLRELADKWKGDETLLAPVHSKMAELQLKLDRATDAEVSANKSMQAFEAQLKKEETKDKSRMEEEHIKACRLKGEALQAQKKDVAALEVYSQIIDKYPKRKDLDSIQFKMGEILFDRGDLRGAQDIWAKLASSKDEFYNKLATQKLKQAEWESDYRKYISRIPAMTEKR